MSINIQRRRRFSKYRVMLWRHFRIKMLKLVLES